MSRKKVQITHIDDQLRALHAAMLDMVAVLNRPQGDEKLIREAAIPLERALFPLLVLIERFGPIGVVDLADRVGRDYTTVSRQVTKLEGLELVSRQARTGDRRVSDAVIAPKGKAMTDAVDAARSKIGQAIFSTWAPQEVDDLVRLTRKFVEAIKDDARSAG